MAILSKKLPNSNFTRIFGGIHRAKLSHRALLLYLLLAERPAGRDYTDKYLMKALDITNCTLGNAKKELKEKDLLYVHRTGPKSYVMFIGYPEWPASKLFEEYMTEGKEVSEDD